MSKQKHAILTAWDINMNMNNIECRFFRLKYDNKYYAWIIRNDRDRTGSSYIGSKVIAEIKPDKTVIYKAELTEAEIEYVKECVDKAIIMESLL
jgi:hypothetical protein